MQDLISRQAAIDALNGQISVTGDINAKAVQNYIRMVNQRLHDLPSAQPERCEDCRNFNKARLLIPQPERKKGEWIIVTDSRGRHAECPYCGEWEYHSKQKFCGECGARMEEQDERT